MSHKPRKPKAAQAPWPAHPAPHDHSADAAKAKADEAASGSRIDKRVVAGIAVGSAAVAAALLFAGRLSKPKSAAPSPPPPVTPKSGAPNAKDILIGETD